MIKLQYSDGEKSKMVSFASSIRKNIAAPSAQSRFPVKLACCIAFGSASSTCFLLYYCLLIMFFEIGTM